MKILIERERENDRKEKGEGRERETETKRKKRRVSEGRKRENLTYCSSADPTTFRVLLISRQKERERERGQRASISELSVCLMCQKLYDG